MRKEHSRAALAVVTICVALLASCGLGLEPAKEGTVIAISVGEAGASGRAVISSSGYLYLRAWPEEVGVGGVTYGPYAVSGGGRFLTSDVPGRTYAGLDVIFSADALDPLALESTTELSGLGEAAKGRASAARLLDEAIVPNRVNELSVTLVPLVDAASVAILDSLTYATTISGTCDGVSDAARFYKITGVPTAIPLVRLALKATATGGDVSLSLYGENGVRLRDFAFDAESIEWRLADPTAAAYYLLVTGTASSFAIAVSAVPEDVPATVTISFANPATPTVTGSIAAVTSADTVTVTASSGFAEYAWALNGVSISGATTNVCAINLSTATGAVVGNNVVSLRVRTGAGEYYSAFFTFTMTE